MRAITIAAVLAVTLSPALAQLLPTPTPAQRALCEADAKRLCQSALPDPFKVLACFKANRSKLSPGCAALLQQYGQ